MKTLLVISHSSSLTGGGEEDFLRLIKYLNGKYHLIGIFPEGKKSVEYGRYVDDYLIIPNRMFPFTKFTLKSYLGFTIKAFNKFSLIKSFLKTKKIDLAYIHSSVCIYEAIIINWLGIPYVISIREFINPLLTRKIIYNYYLKTSVKIIVISDILKKEFLKLKLNSEKLELVYPAIEEFYMECPAKKIHELVILNIGNIFPDKGQDKVIKAYGKIEDNKDIKIKLIGANVHEAYFQKLKQEIRKLKLENNIFFMGELPRSEVLEEISKSDIVIISSSYEGFSLVLLEALSNKKPVISTKVGVIPEIIVDGVNGLLYNFNDIDMLADKINLLKKDKKLYEKLTENGYNTFKKNFNLENSLYNIEQILRASMKKLVSKCNSMIFY